MEGMIIKYLGKYFELFIKNFSREQFKVELLQKTASLTNLDLNEKVLQEILLIPPTLEVRSGKVNSLEFKIQSLTSLSKTPILLSIDRIDIEVAEPKEISPMPDLWKKFNDQELRKQKEKKDDKEKYNVMKHMTIEIKEVHIHLSTLGHIVTDNKKPSLMFDFYNITIQTTDSNWKVVDLDKLKTSEEGHESFYKQIIVKSCGIQLLRPDMDKPQTVLSRVPTTIHFMGKSTEENGVEQWTEMKVDFYLEEVNFSWNQKQFRTIIELFEELSACLSRHVPEHQVEGEKKNSFADVELSYGIHMDHWAIELHEGEVFQEEEKGFSFFGFGFHVLFVPRRKPTHFKSLVAPGEVPGHESFALIGVTSLSVRKMHLSAETDHRFGKLVSQIPSAKGELEGMFGLKYITYTKAGKQTDDVDQIYAEVKLNSLQFVFDVKELEALVRYFIGAIPDVPASSASLALELVKTKSAKKKLDILKTYKSSGILIEASNLVFVFPRNSSLLPDYPDTSIFANVAKITLNNQPQWTVVPYIEKGVNSLPVNASLGFTKQKDNDATKFQVDLVGVSVEIEKVNAKNDKEFILKPTDIRTCARLLGPQDAPPSFELCLHSGETEVVVKPEWLPYFEKIITAHAKYFEDLLAAQDKPSSEGKSVTEVLSEKIEGSEVLIKKSQEFLQKAKDSPLDAVEETLKQFRVVLFFRAEKGVFDVPLKKLSFELPTAANTTTTTTTTSSTDSDNSLTHLEYQVLELLVENSVDTQSLLGKIGLLKSPEIDHQKLPAAVSLEPMNDINDGKNNFELIYQRFVPKEGGKPFSQLSNRYSGLKVCVKTKPQVLQAEISDVVPVITQYIHEFIDQLTENKDNLLEKMKQKAQAIKEKAQFANNYLDVHWDLELGDCQLVYHNTEGEKDKPRGVVRFSSSAEQELRQKISQLEDELIKTKMMKVQSEMEKEELQSKYKSSNDELRTNYENLEQQFVELKFKSVELQTQNEDLSAQIANINRKKK